MSRSVPPSDEIHPFLKGNFAPVTDEYVDYACEVVQGRVPKELLGGQYIRNGGNPVYPPEKGRHYHWFDGDGMLHGVYFPVDADDSPRYTNRHLATPLLDLTLLLLRSPIPSIALLISPLSSLPQILSAILQAFTIALRARMGVLSVANTSVIWWGRGLGIEAEEERELDDDPLLEVEGTKAGVAAGGDGRLLATCESGPPLEVRVPGLETVGWDRLKDEGGETLDRRRGPWEWFKRFGLSRVQEDWMTAHPRVDPVDGSFIFYSTQMFDAPHARYSVIDRYGHHLVWKHGIEVGRAKMMHDFACTRTHTILLNLPLTLSPANLMSFSPKPLIHFDRTLPSEYVIFPRLQPDRILRFIDPEPCLIFHTANAWDEVVDDRVIAINMLGCRFKSAKLVYSAGAVDVPKVERAFGKDDIVQLYYYRFEMPIDPNATHGTISHAFPLTAIPFEFPTIPAHLGMSSCRYVYGCTMASGSFDERLGGAAKVDCLVKIDVLALIAAGRRRGRGKINEAVDSRSAAQIIREGHMGHAGPVSIFQCPTGWYAQEPRFVPRTRARDEDDGYLLTYVYDEQYLTPDGTPSTRPGSGSELWVIDAKRMHLGVDAITCRIKLPQRVPYGLHGTWLPPSAFSHQRPLPQPLDSQPLLQDKLARSRLQHFVSIIFDRPPTRDKSIFERVVLAVLYPAALVLFATAVFEAYQWCRPTYTSAAPHIAPFEEEVQTTVVSPRVVPPYLLEALAIGFLSLGYWLWPTPGAEDELGEPIA